MRDILTTIFSVKMPDIFRVAAHAWGIDIQCLCLIPISFSIGVLFLGFIDVINILISNNIKKKYFWFAISFFLVILIVSKSFWWWQIFNIFSDTTMSLKVFLFLSQVVSFFSICLLLIKSLSLDSRKAKINFLLMVIYGSTSFLLFWKYMDGQLISEPIFVVGESLILVSFSYIAIFIHREFLYLTSKI